MKKTNKGFSLVELIIVIAIMAILAGAIAPALIKYIDKSRKSNDVSSAKAIKTAIETALGTESVYETLTNVDTSKTATVIEFKQGAQCAALSSTGDWAYGMNIKDCTPPEGAASKIDCAKAIGSNIGDKTPKVKYKKETGTNGKPSAFVALVSNKGTVYVGVKGTGTPAVSADGVVSGMIELTPNLDEAYQ